MLAGRIEDRFVHTEKVSQIIVALQGNLDFEHGGEISPMLYDFYNTIFRQLQEANLRNSVKAIEDVILGLNNVRASWHELAERTNGTPQAVLAPPRSEEHTSELQSLMRHTSAAFCMNTKHYTSHSTST